MHRLLWVRRGAPIGCALILALALVGCTKNDRGLTDDQRASSDRLGVIATRTQGEWDRLTPEERDFLVKELSHGSEQSARMLLLSASGKVGGKGGGPSPTNR
jgi:hypothetical protein